MSNFLVFLSISILIKVIIQLGKATFGAFMPEINKITLIIWVITGLLCFILDLVRFMYWSGEDD